MRIPKIKHRGKLSPNEITTINIKDVPEVKYYPDIDFDDPKSVDSYVKHLKYFIRKTREYKDLMKFLKTKRGMYRSFFMPNVKHMRGDKISIEAHHTGFVMTDIIKTVLIKRNKNDEDIDFCSVADEVMLLHYKGMISITSLDSTSHDLIHEEGSSLFIPLGMEDFGDMNLFYEEYKQYMHKDLVKKFETYKLLSHTVENINDIIPDYMDVNIIYYEHDGIKIPDMNAILDIIK
jgi:hypothetical protein